MATSEPHSTVAPGEPGWAPPDKAPADWDFSYLHTDLAPQRHQRVMEMACTLLESEDIAHYLNADLHWVKRVIDHPPNRDRIERIRFRLEHMQRIAGMHMGEIILDGVEYCRGILKNPKSNHHEKMDVLKWATDHHPEGTFAKRSKVDQTHTHLIQTEGQMQTLLENGQAAGKELERDRARVVEVQPQEVEENLLKDEPEGVAAS